MDNTLKDTEIVQPHNDHRPGDTEITITITSNRSQAGANAITHQVAAYLNTLGYTGVGIKSLQTYPYKPHPSFVNPTLMDVKITVDGTLGIPKDSLGGKTAHRRQSVNTLL